MIDDPKWGCLGSVDIFKFGEITDNVLVMVQDRGVVTMDD